MKMTPQIKVALVIAGCVILLGGIGIAAFLPLTQKTKSYASDKVKAESDLTAAKMLLAKRTQYKNDQSDLQNKINAQNAQVPQNAELSTVVRTIQDLAYENNHWMTSVKNSTPVKTEGEKYNAWDTEIVLEGQWLNTLSFLRDLRDLDRQVRVNKIDFARITDMVNKGDGPNRMIKHWNPGHYPVKTTISCTIYYIPEGAVSATSTNKKADTKTGTAEQAQGGNN